MPEIICNLAVTGFGLVGKRHAEAIRRHPELRLAAIVEPESDKQAAIRALGADWYRSLEDLFAATSIDGVILATPTPMHVEQGLTCVANGCPALVEKPIATGTAEAARLVEAARLANVPLLIGHHRRHNGVVQAARRAIDDGAIGDIRSAHMTCWLYKPDRYFEEAHWRKCSGAGPVSVNLIHDIDLLRYFCGDVAAVQAQARPSARGFENEDVAAALLTFTSGAIATVTVSDSIVSPWSWEMTARENPAYPATNESSYLIGGSKGSLSLPDLRIWQHEGRPDWWSPIVAKSIVADRPDPLEAQIIHFARVVRGEEAPIVPGVEGLRSIEVIEAIQKAAASGMAVPIPRRAA